MPMEAQTRLLRVLQEGEYTTVGGRTPIKTDVRIIAATNRDLQTADRAGPVPRGSVLPAQRRAAAPAAAARAAGGHSRPGAPLPARRGQGGPAATRSIETAAIERLKRYHWPGNVRELENLVRRLAALYPEDIVTADIVEEELAEARAAADGRGRQDAQGPLRARSSATSSGYFASFGRELPPPGLYDRILQQVERPLITAALAATRGNQIRAAELLGLNRNTLRKKIRDLDIQVFRTPAA